MQIPIIHVWTERGLVGRDRIQKDHPVVEVMPVEVPDATARASIKVVRKHGRGETSERTFLTLVDDLVMIPAYLDGVDPEGDRKSADAEVTKATRPGTLQRHVVGFGAKGYGINRSDLQARRPGEVRDVVSSTRDRVLSLEARDAFRLLVVDGEFSRSVPEATFSFVFEGEDKLKIVGANDGSDVSNAPIRDEHGKFVHVLAAWEVAELAKAGGLAVRYPDYVGDPYGMVELVAEGDFSDLMPSLRDDQRVVQAVIGEDDLRVRGRSGRIIRRIWMEALEAEVETTATAPDILDRLEAALSDPAYAADNGTDALDRLRVIRDEKGRIFDVLEESAPAMRM